MDSQTNELISKWQKQIEKCVMYVDMEGLFSIQEDLSKEVEKEFDTDDRPRLSILWKMSNDLHDVVVELEEEHGRRGVTCMLESFFEDKIIDAMSDDEYERYLNDKHGYSISDEYVWCEEDDDLLL